MQLATMAALFTITAVAEIVGCYLPYLVASPGQIALASHTCCDQPGGFRLPSHLASHGHRARLRRVWRCLYFGCVAVVMARRWYSPCCRRLRGSVTLSGWHGGNHVRATPVNAFTGDSVNLPSLMVATRSAATTAAAGAAAAERIPA